jgi:aspartyl-tRNA(Asn)/glutamyl-tRNA(Gln) amidotransferase subunit A
MADTSLLFALIADVSSRLREGALSPVALTERCLARIAALNPHLNAFITVTAELARDQARGAERDLKAGTWLGPLHGVPVAVKDFYDTAGIRTTAAFEPFEHRVPDRDADVVVMLREAGAVLVGTTNMHRLGMGTTSLDSHFGPVVNPWNERQVAGGSSGGSAVAVATGMCFATVDTDAVGSGRLPAAICGVSCFKPTFGVLSAAGILAGEREPDPAIPFLSHPCVTARSADDVALAFEAVSKRSGENAQPVRRVAVVTNFTANTDVRMAFDEAVEALVRLDVVLSETEVPFDEASFDVRSIEEDRAGIDATLFGDVDAIVLPTLAAPAPTIAAAREQGDLAVRPDNTFFCNYFGLPAITVPAGVDRKGLPLGIQFVGPPGGDGTVLALARAYQRTAPWRFEPPHRLPRPE